MMDLAQALDIVVARTRHGRFRELCDPGHPDHDPAYAALVLAMAQPVMTMPPLALPRVRPVAASEATEAEKGCGCGRA